MTRTSASLSVSSRGPGQCQASRPGRQSRARCPVPRADPPAFIEEPDTAQENIAPARWPTMRIEAFCGPAGKIARKIEPHTESDPVTVLLSLHTFFGNAVGRGPYYQIEGDQHSSNLFALIIGETAKARK